jgi:hypothetical protein
LVQRPARGDTGQQRGGTNPQEVGERPLSHGLSSRKLPGSPTYRSRGDPVRRPRWGAPSLDRPRRPCVECDRHSVTDIVAIIEAAEPAVQKTSRIRRKNMRLTRIGDAAGRDEWLDSAEYSSGSPRA